MVRVIITAGDFRGNHVPRSDNGDTHGGIASAIPPWFNPSGEL
ncbi:MAG: hypothetical protein WEE53_05300 [Acidimicrobiia bacterium]